MHLNKLELMVIGTILLFAGAAAGALVGAVYTQAQLNSFSKDTIANNIEFSLDSVSVEGDVVFFNLGFVHLEKQGAVYGVIEDKISVALSREKLNDCIRSRGLSSCRSDVLRPYLVGYARSVKAREVGKIESWQKGGDLFSVKDLAGVVSDAELNS